MYCVVSNWLLYKHGICRFNLDSEPQWSVIPSLYPFVHFNLNKLCAHKGRSDGNLNELTSKLWQLNECQGAIYLLMTYFADICVSTGTSWHALMFKKLFIFHTACAAAPLFSLIWLVSWPALLWSRLLACHVHCVGALANRRTSVT